MKKIALLLLCVTLIGGFTACSKKAPAPVATDLENALEAVDETALELTEDSELPCEACDAEAAEAADVE